MLGDSRLRSLLKKIVKNQEKMLGRRKECVIDANSSVKGWSKFEEDWSRIEEVANLK
jgi:hypothetical protein